MRQRCRSFLAFNLVNDLVDMGLKCRVEPFAVGWPSLARAGHVKIGDKIAAERVPVVASQRSDLVLEENVLVKGQNKHGVKPEAGPVKALQRRKIAAPAHHQFRQVGVAGHVVEGTRLGVGDLQIGRGTHSTGVIADLNADEDHRSDHADAAEDLHNLLKCHWPALWFSLVRPTQKGRDGFHFEMGVDSATALGQKAINAVLGFGKSNVFGHAV